MSATPLGYLTLLIPKKLFASRMYKVDGDKYTLTQEAPPKLLAPTNGEFYVECHRPVSTEEKAVLYAIDKLSPDQIKVTDGKPQDAEQSGVGDSGNLAPRTQSKF